MSLTKSRKILAVLLTFIIAIGGVLFFSAEIINYTLCNEIYMTKVFSSDSLNAQCEQNFIDRTEAISAKSGIPSRVFEAILDNNATPNKTAVQRMFSGNDAGLYSEDLIEQFESLCTEYLEGNQISYDKTMVYNTAVYAAEIYSDSFGIRNYEEAMAFVDGVNTEYSKYSSIGLLLLVVSTALFLMIYSKRSDAFKAVCAAYNALGASLFLIGACGLIFSARNAPLLSPQIYAEAVSSAAGGAFAFSIIVGILIIAASVTGLRSQHKKTEMQ